MNIIKQMNDQRTFEEMAKLTRGQDKLSNHAGETIRLRDWIIYEETNLNTGEIVTICSLMLEDGTVYATNSKTFITEFMYLADMAVMFDRTLSTITIDTGRSRNGRTFYTCKAAL